MAGKTRSTSTSGDDDKIQQLISAMNERFDKFDQKLDHQYTNLISECKKLSEAISKVESGLSMHKEEVLERLNILEKFKNETVRYDRLNEILVKNVPQLKQESLIDLFTKISETIGFERDIYQSVDSIFRLGNQSKNHNRSPPILIKFTSQLLKRQFLSKYYVCGKLSLNNIGFESQDRVFINENLSPTVNNIYVRALLLKKNNLVEKVVTKSGCVYIKFPGKADLIKINSILDLPKTSIISSINSLPTVSSGITGQAGSSM